MDLTSQQAIEQNIDEYLDNIAALCLQTSAISYLSEDQQERFAQKIRDYFYQAVLETLVDRLNEQQFSQIEHLDPSSEEMVQKVQELASQIPGLFNDIQARVQKDVEYIRQNSKLPDQNFL